MNSQEHTATGTCRSCEGTELSHHHDRQSPSPWTLFRPALVSFILFASALLTDIGWLPHPAFFDGWIRLFWYVLAYLPVGGPVILEMCRAFRKKELFSEFTLMVVATLGAFAIGEYPEGVAVMLFYAVGENLQSLAVGKAKSNIKKLLDQRPDKVTLRHGDTLQTINAKQASVGQILQLKPGEKLALDGELLSDRASFDTAALTGESKPDTKVRGDAVLAGMINLNTVAEVCITASYNDSKLNQIIALVQEATSKKAPTELFIRKFAKIYTPIVVLSALLITVLPAFFLREYVLAEWLYRALVFLVISCPCALVISIPLGYFGGIGAASRHGILFRGSSFLDILATVSSVVMDKTGTLTKGVFTVQEVSVADGFDPDLLLARVNALERNSTHPVATAVAGYLGPPDRSLLLTDVEEIPGYGMRGLADGKELLVGNSKLLDKYGIRHEAEESKSDRTIVAIGYDKRFAGYLTIADELRPDARKAVRELQALGITPMMLSGDRTHVVQEVAQQLDLAEAYGDLLPQEKADKITQLKSRGKRVAFVGDGVNDAPVIALSDVGIAMGGLGSDATVETADVVIQDDMPSKIPVAIRIGRATRRIVWQNITLAFTVKAVVLILGAEGIANMWEAVFADVGVALLAIANAIRIQRMYFSSF